MADTKKEWSNKSTAEKLGQILVNVLVIGIALFATAFAWWIKQPCDIDKQYLYCCTHPSTWGDYVGTALFWFGCVWLSGIWGYFVQGDDSDPYDLITKIAWGCALSGPFLVIFF